MYFDYIYPSLPPLDLSRSTISLQILSSYFSSLLFYFSLLISIYLCFIYIPTSFSSLLSSQSLSPTSPKPPSSTLPFYAGKDRSAMDVNKTWQIKLSNTKHLPGWVRQPSIEYRVPKSCKRVNDSLCSHS